MLVQLSVSQFQSSVAALLKDSTAVGLEAAARKCAAAGAGGAWVDMIHNIIQHDSQRGDTIASTIQHYRFYSAL